MFWRRKPRCTAPEVGCLLAEFLSEELLSPGREADLERFSRHMDECPVCRDACLEDAHQRITVPYLKKLAEKTGLPFEQIAAEYCRQVQQAIKEGNLKPTKRRR